jgi:hypothetical protein
MLGPEDDGNPLAGMYSVDEGQLLRRHRSDAFVGTMLTEFVPLSRLLREYHRHLHVQGASLGRTTRSRFETVFAKQLIVGFLAKCVTGNNLRPEAYATYAAHWRASHGTWCKL